MDRADRFWSKISTFIKHPGQYWQHWVSLPFWNHVFNNVGAFQPNGAIQFPNLGGDLRHHWSNTSHLQLLQVQPSKESTMSSYYLCFLQGSICLPGEAWSSTPGLGHVVVSAFEFYNGDNLLFPAFQTHPQSNLSSIISLSVDNNSKVELPQDGEPIRIRFNQVTQYIIVECDFKWLLLFKPSNPHEISCGFWDMENQWWSDEGCVLNLAQSNGMETVCDCFHLTPFSLFMDWTGECFGLPSSPALDIITKVRFSFLWFWVTDIDCK